MVKVVGLDNGQGIEVSAKPDSPVASAAAQRTNHARPSDASSYLKAKFTELICNESRCSVLFKRQFGVPVEVATPLREFRVRFGNFWHHVH